MPSSERRKNQRTTFPVVVKYRQVGLLMEMWQEARMADLSAGGLRLIGRQPLERGVHLELQILLPIRQEPYLMSGQTVWQREVADGYEYGVAFLDMTPDKQVQLDELVQFMRNRRTKAP